MTRFGGATIDGTFDPLTDLRASRAYRLKAAGNLLRRFYLQQQGEPVASRTVDALLDLS